MIKKIYIYKHLRLSKQDRFDQFHEGWGRPVLFLIYNYLLVANVNTM